jgi:H+/Cl- antiporter ClcA
MSKATVTRIFWGSLIAIAGGLIVLAIATGLGFAGTRFIMSGHDLVAVQPTSTTWAAASMGIIGILALIGGAFGQFVAWIGTLLNTAQLEDKVWFLVLLLLGIVGLGLIPMLVYVVTGPDGTATAAPEQEGPTDLPKAA